MPENKYKFNDIEQNTDFDLNMYDAFYRNFNPHIGRWWQIDPKPTEWVSLYSAMGNNPVLKNDPLGDTIIVRYTDNTAHTSDVIYRKGAVSPRSMDVVIPDNLSQYMSNVTDDLNAIGASKDKELTKRLATLENSEKIHLIEMPAPGERIRILPIQVQMINRVYQRVQQLNIIQRITRLPEAI